jgi:hypothetical protein
VTDEVSCLAHSRLLRRATTLRVTLPLPPGQTAPRLLTADSGPHRATWQPLLAGIPVHVVAARLGHADPVVTLRVYSHVQREHALGVGMSSPRSSRLLLANPLASQAAEIIKSAFMLVRSVVRGGVEPPTFRFSGLRIMV